MFATNTAAPDLPPLLSQQQQHHNKEPHREAESKEDQHQDSKDEIKVIIEDELARLRKRMNAFGSCRRTL
jgi:protein required for attachment to host cells